MVCIEATITSLAEVSNGVLILANGVYGDRAAQIAQVFGIPHTLEQTDWTRPLPMKQVESLIRETSHDTVYLIHHETTTGVLNPLREIAETAKRNGKWVLVDAVSSIAGEDAYEAQERRLTLIRSPFVNACTFLVRLVRSVAHCMMDNCRFCVEAKKRLLP